MLSNQDECIIQISGEGEVSGEPLDFLGVFVRNGQQGGIADGHIGADHSILMDDRADVEEVQFSLAANAVSATFARRLNTSDPNDVDLSKCFVSIVYCLIHFKLAFIEGFSEVRIFSGVNIGRRFLEKHIVERLTKH
ncbi:unnamed protein product [Gongylonema pulchrum]|uniref:Uncharacterized protein n=1 Tax=Gongylonema pulchrum TaxID=637853 RepID=A0A183ECB6_9BILA|nr:unnamed protein product [Gongylonema pulchrum]